MHMRSHLYGRTSVITYFSDNKLVYRFSACNSGGSSAVLTCTGSQQYRFSVSFRCRVLVSVNVFMIVYLLGMEMSMRILFEHGDRF